MPALPIMCMVCGDDVEESVYPAHMEKHGGMGNQLNSIAAQKNVPKQSNLPPELAALPDAEFLKTVQEMEQAATQPQKPPTSQSNKPQDSSTKASPPFSSPVAEYKAPLLKYQYEGQCEKGHPIVTLELDAKGSHIVVAYCSVCRKQIDSREVADLNDIIVFSHEKQIPTPIVNTYNDPYFCYACGRIFKKQRALTMHKWRAKHE